MENLAEHINGLAPTKPVKNGDADASIGESYVTEALRRSVAAVLNCPPEDIDPEIPMNSFPIDSLRVVEIQVFLETRHGILVGAESLQSSTPLCLVSSSRAKKSGPDPAIFWRDGALDLGLTPAFGGAAKDEVLVTGGTGMVGSHLIANLIKKTKGRLYCLVRNRGQVPGPERLARQLQAVGVNEADINDRVVPLEGNVARPDLGLPPETLNQLAEDVGTIYHNAAELNFLRPYEKLKPVNVDGTRTILALAAKTRSKKVAHVSSVSVLETLVRSGRSLDENTPLDHPESLATGYAQSKWVADLLAMRARDRGFDVRIFRPPWILAPVVGASESSGFIVRFLQTCIALGAIPDSQFGWNIVTPDFVAQAITEGMTANGQEQAVYHLGSSKLLYNRAFQKAFAQAGVNLELIPTQDWKKLFKATLIGDRKTPLQPLASLFFQNTDGANAADSYVEGRLPVMDSTATLGALAAAGVYEKSPDLVEFIRHAVLKQSG